MRHRLICKLAVIAVAGLFVVLAFSGTSFAQNYERTYFLLRERSTYSLTLSVTPSLFEYYQGKSHQLSPQTFASFVTPYSMALVAGDIRSLFPNEEDFVNAVLMLVHQIPYVAVEGAMYPVETIVENRGDCDLFSYVAASLIRAQSLDVVLFYYEEESHMNIGVSLPSAPREARTTVSYVDYGGVRYYVAETTGDDWQNGWRVGECPPELENADLAVVTLENSERVAPGQVSSSFGALESSVISLTASTSFLMEGSPVLLSGQVGVSAPSGTVTLYGAVNGEWFAIETVQLDSNGRYVLSWNPRAWGQYHVKASWSGDAKYAGADSGTVSVFVIPRFLVFVGGGLIIVALISVVVWMMHRTANKQVAPPSVVYQ